MTGETLWKKGTGVLFGQMYEDHAIEMRALPSGSRVFCIASAGCTALALAGSHEVTAVDINRAQLEYARQRAQGMPARRGLAERMMQGGRYVMKMAGWTRARLEHFLAMTDTTEQVAFWKRELNGLRFRVLFDLLIWKAAWIARILGPQRAILPPVRFGPTMRARLERGLARHANATNPYARRQFLGELPQSREKAAIPVRFEHADAVEYLEQSPAGSFTAFSLSNIIDGVTSAYYSRLVAAVRHAGTRNAMLVLRTFADPVTRAGAELAAEDRAMIWGSVYVGEATSIQL